MTNDLNTPPPLHLRKLASTAVRRLQEAGFTAFWAGGCVRDILLGRCPNDYDIATSADPDDIARLFSTSKPIGKSFGVMQVSFRKASFQIATFRQDLAYSDGRRPDRIAFSTPDADARRRDFTVNALFFDPVSQSLHDFVGGRADLDQKLIRSVMPPSQCFADDHLRMLRAVRFASVLAFTIDPDTAAAIRSFAHLLARVSVERTREEFTRILTESPRPGNAILLLDDLNLLSVMFPDIVAAKGHSQPPEFHPEGDVFQHIVAALNLFGAHPPDFPDLPPDQRPHARRQLAYAILFHDVGKPLTAQQTPDRVRYNRHAEEGADRTEKILQAYRFPSDDIRIISHCVRNHMRFMSVRDMRRATLLRLIGAPTFPIELELHRIDCLASHGHLDNVEFLLRFLAQRANERPLPKPWISGNDLLNMGIPQGPQIGLWRTRAYDAQLESRFPDRDKLLLWLREEIQNAPSPPPIPTTPASGRPRRPKPSAPPPSSS